MATLVLSSSFLPLKVVSWQKAFCLLFSGRAEKVHVCSERFVRSVSRSYPVPTVIRYRNGGQKYFARNGMTRHALYKRDQGKCVYCGVFLRKEHMTKDHVVPRCQGGKDKWQNVVISCRSCNRKKGGRTPEQAGMPIQEPCVPHVAFLKGKYHEHWKPYLFH